MCNCREHEHHDAYNHPLQGDEAANAIWEANQTSLKRQIDAVKAAMRLNTDMESLAALDQQLNSLSTQYALQRRLRLGELPE